MTALKYWDAATGTWKFIGNVQGPTGLTGAQGPQGIQGIPGPATLETYIGTAAPSPRGDYTVWVDTDEPDPDPLAVEATHLVGTAGEPGLGAGYSLYAAGWQAIGFYKNNQSQVFLQGMLKKSSAVVSGDVLWTLPVGYRPLAQTLFAIISNAAIGRVDVYPDGRVAVLTGNAAWISLAGLNFRAEQ
jgi:hypothetical protein